MSPTVKTVIVTLGWLGCGSGGKTLSQKCKKKKKKITSGWACGRD